MKLSEWKPQGLTELSEDSPLSLGGEQKLTRDEAIQIVQKCVDYGDMSVRDMLDEYYDIIKHRPSEVSEAEFKSIIEEYAPGTPHTKVLCLVETPDKKHKCVRDKNHTQKSHKDIQGYSWSSSGASRPRLDGKCKHGHTILLDGKPTANAYEYPKGSGKYRCRQCGKDYSNKAYHKDNLVRLEEALKKLRKDGSWFDFKAKCNQEKLEVLQAFGNLLQLPLLNPDVLDYLHQAELTPTVGVETPRTVQEEPRQPGKYVGPFTDPEVESKPHKSNANIF